MVWSNFSRGIVFRLYKRKVYPLEGDINKYQTNVFGMCTVNVLLHATCPRDKP